MKVIYLHQYFKKPSMSGGVRSYEFAKRLVLDGHKVYLITTDTENNFKGWRVENVDGIEVHWISISYNNKFGVIQRLYAFFKFVFFASCHILTIKADKVFATSTPLTIAIPAIFYKLLRRKPYVFEVRDVWPEVPIAMGFLDNKVLKKLAIFLERIAYKYSESIITLSPDMKKSVKKTVRNKKVSVIPNASDTHLFDKDELSGKVYDDLSLISRRHEKVVFYTGTLGMVNNLKYLISLAAFSEGDLGFVIIGSGKEREILESLSKENNTLNRTVYFYEAIPKSTLYIVHRLFDISASTVLPIKELYSNSANKIFDAFASGTPILINSAGWLQELIKKYNCGIALDKEPNLNEFNRLKRFLYDDELFQTSQLNSKKLGETTFNREVLYLKFKEIIEG